MPKRKKVSLPEDGADEIHRKRRRGNADLGDIFQTLYSAMQTCKSEDGRVLCETFIRAPKKRVQADYYDVVATPMDLLTIHQKIKSSEYTELDQLTADVELMVNNTKAYYKEGSQEFKDAEEMWEAYQTAKTNLLSTRAKEEEMESMELDGGSLTGAVSDSTDEDHYEELFTSVMTAADAEGRCISSMFQLLPSRTLYPEYYKIITEPIDLKLIATKIQDSAYTNLGELEKDLMLLIRNAKTFNEPGSQIYKDATQLKKAVRIKKAEIDQRRNAPGKCSERIRSKRIMASQKLSAITAALKYEDNEPPITVAATRVSLPEGTAVSAADESDDDSGAPEDVDNSPMWQLLETVRTYQSQGYFLAEPFTKLPSKRLYPDYYREIRQPISLNKIAAKIKDEVYSCTMDTVDDLNLLFENAKRYNRPDSKIFKDAVKLQKVMQAKARELLNCNIKIPESDSEGEVEEKVKRKSKKVVTPVSARRGPKPQEDLVLKKRLKALIRSLVNYADDSGRPLISIFMERPSKRDYPDYYEVISNPIDMRTIEENAKSNKYMTEEAMISDLRLMFNNCRLYNEEGSQIYQDADTLERVLNEKIKELGPPGDSRTPRTMPRRNKGRNYKLRVLYDTIKEYTDAKGRRLSTIFMKLPSRAEYPDYYEVIKKPIDLERIATRLLKHNQYESLDDLLADFNLLFDNACKYNEPDSQIYKDALTLQRIVLQTKLELSSEEMEDGGVPDVRTLVQEMLTNLFISVYNHQDDEGRCYSDSIVELSETASDGAGAPEERKLLTLDIIKRRLDRGCYVRLDRFQEDMFEVFERARRVSRTDSQAFEDSVELQSYFIKLRDELCGMGDVLQSPALNYASQDLAESVEAMKAQKLPQEQQEAAAEQTTQEEQKEVQRNNEASSSDSTEHRGIVIHVGDFVYVEPREKGMEPHITSVDRLWRDKSGEQWLYGCWFYRPNETFHLASRKFLEKELFKSDNYNSTPVNQVLGKCYVMPVKDYFKSYPKGFDDKDVYVCESRYSAKAKAFKKIKIWNFVFNEHTQLVPREELLSAVRVPSVFKDGVDKLGEDEEELKLVEKPRANVSLPPANDDEIAVYYEQLNLPSGVYKLGDCCYVRTEHSKTLIGRIDKMWMDKDGNGFYHGPWFVTPSEIQHQPSRTFYRQEVFLSSIEDTNPLLSIVGRCSVLDYKDYTTCRLTEINEQDIYICESRYMEAERQIRKLPKGLKKFLHSDAVTADEVYYFKHSITPQKIEPTPEPETVPTTDEMSPNMSRVTSETDNEESNDVPSSSLGRDENSNLSSASGKKKSSKRLVTGYLLFAGEIRKSIVAANPDKSFGDISRLVGNEWRNLQPSQKVDFEERAQRVNEDANSMDSLPQSPASSACGEGSRDGGPRTPGGGADLPTLSTTVYECLWDTCEAQYETQQELVDHLAQEPNGHVYQSYLGFKDNNEFQCLWPNCARVKKNVPPFPNIQKLLRHVREVHVKTAGKIIMPDVKARSFTPSKKGVASPAPAGQPGAAAPAPPERTLEPIFVAPPPLPHKLLHTYTYIKYIESLQSDSKHVSNWDTQLKATKDNTPVYDASRLPTHWLGNGVGGHGNAVNALWALRDFMLRDALNISRIS
ncbi:protein polybromo-1-like isoform X2 [Ornithodoros turicata]|uniref:protein polybromo-1-like isoform X2 n=1 Tax=Ornithodoros turicata TaxID=34597 RepID=UPI003139307D